jgi:hypothetical integral membrane protein (TIGR02206 family)
MAPTMSRTAEYVVPLLATGFAITVLAVFVRVRPGAAATAAVRLLAVFVLASEVAWWIYAPLHWHWSATHDLPFHLSDISPLVAAAALWWRRRLLVEVLYFWVLAGGVQALLTPSIGDHFPGFVWWQYYAAHGGVLAAAIVLVVGLRIHPARGAVLRVLAITLGYTLLVAAVDAATGGNYMFLRHPPPGPTLLDLMGPWPWYLAGATGLCVVLFVALDAPFALARRRANVKGQPVVTRRRSLGAVPPTHRR